MGDGKKSPGRGPLSRRPFYAWMRVHILRLGGVPMRLRSRLRATRPVAVSSALRRGAAAAELAILLPILAFLFAIGADYARIFHYSTTIANCARNGAMYLYDPYIFNESTPRYATLTDAAL